MIYLDFAATTPIHPQVLGVYTQVASRYYGNASSLHDAGSSAKQIIGASAKVIAEVFNGVPRGLTFTSGATESNFLALLALVDGRGDDRKQIISSRIEHSSVLNVLDLLAKEGYQIDWVDVDEQGVVKLDHLQALVSDKTALVSIQHINSELGTIQPLEEISKIIAPFNIRFHSDCVQSFGKIPFDVQSLNIDAISISAHKIYGPKGVAAIWMNPETHWQPLLDDPGQRKSLRFGTANTPGIAAFAAAAKQIVSTQESEFERLSDMRSRLISELKKTGYEIVIEGSEKDQSPYILGIRFPGLEGQFFMLECSQAELAISTGSACQVGSEKPNRTMKAIGRTDEEAREFVRLSFGTDVKEHQIPEIIEKIDIILNRHFSKVHRTVES